MGRKGVLTTDRTGCLPSARSKGPDGFAQVQFPAPCPPPHTCEIPVWRCQQLPPGELLRDKQQTNRRRQGAQVRFNPLRERAAYARYGSKGRYRLGRPDIRRVNQPIGFGE